MLRPKALWLSIRDVLCEGLAKLYTFRDTGIVERIAEVFGERYCAKMP